MISAARLKHYRNLSGFFLTRRFIGFSVPAEPHFDEAGTSMFVSLIRQCRSYLEYGAGGSTVMAANLNKPFITVETDRLFLKSVGKKIGKLSPAQHLVHADIGLTGPWGVPLRAKNPPARRLKKWRSYAYAPWQRIGGGDLPDLVLIDGRFRVAAALASALHLQTQPDALILVDDYTERPYYHELQNHMKLTGLYGRMAAFHPSQDNNHKLQEMVERYSTDWR